MELQGWKPQSAWGKRIYAEGRAKGEAEGRAKGEAEGRVEGLAEGVLTLLRVRSIALTRAQRERIQSCRDVRRLRKWLRRAGTARTASELFGSRGGAGTSRS